MKLLKKSWLVYSSHSILLLWLWYGSEHGSVSSWTRGFNLWSLTTLCRPVRGLCLWSLQMVSDRKG